MVASAPARRGAEPGRKRDLGSGGRVAEKSAGADEDVRATESGIPLERVYGEEDVAGLDLHDRLGEPGDFPYTRGIHPTMYRDKPWTMRQYAGFATAEETNARFRYLLAAGAPGLSTAFDLPTQLGLDSDDPLAAGEVGRVGVAIDSVEDMGRLLDGIPLDRVSTSMTINAPASVLLLLYQLVAEENGVDPATLRGTVQNDVLKEYVARGNYIYPPVPSMRLTTDTFAYCDAELPRWNTISISGYHIREAGSTAVQEVAFTLANGIAYVEAALEAGLDVDTFGPRLSFFFNSHNNLLEEVAKFRAARTLWAHIMRDRFGATEARAMTMRFHAQTGGSTLTAQQPRINVVRVAVQVLAAALGGAQSIHSNGFDEALALPTEESAKLALRTQQVIAAESGIVDTVDPLGGSYAVEALTAEIEGRARELIDEIDRRGGAVMCIEYMRDAIAEAAFRHHEEVDAGERVVVGVNAHHEDDEQPVSIQRIDPPDRDRPGRAAAHAAREPRRGAGAGAARRRARRGPRHRQPALPPARGAAGPGHRGGGLRRDARGVRRVRPGAGGGVVSTGEKRERLRKLREEAAHAGTEAAVERQHARGQAHRPRAHRPAAGPGQLHRARHVHASPRPRLRPGGQPALGRRGRDRPRHDRRPQGVPVQSGLHRLRRQPGRGLRREDRQGHGPRGEDGLPVHRHQRLRAAPASRRAS